MAIVNLRLETLGALDEGRAQAIIDAEINAAIKDLDDRGGDGQKRKVVIELTMFRNKHERVETTVKAQAKLPPRQVYPTDSKLTHHPKHPGQMTLLFNENSPANLNQKTIIDGGKDGTVETRIDGERIEPAGDE